MAADAKEKVDYDNKSRQIVQLHEDKRKLELELGEVRVAMCSYQAALITSKMSNRPEAKVKTYETWQIVAVMMLAIFLGYFVGTK